MEDLKIWRHTHALKCQTALNESFAGTLSNFSYKYPVRLFLSSQEFFPLTHFLSYYLKMTGITVGLTSITLSYCEEAMVVLVHENMRKPIPCPLRLSKIQLAQWQIQRGACKTSDTQNSGESLQRFLMKSSLPSGETHKTSGHSFPWSKAHGSGGPVSLIPSLNYHGDEVKTEITASSIMFSERDKKTPWRHPTCSP